VEWVQDEQPLLRLRCRDARSPSSSFSFPSRLSRLMCLLVVFSLCFLLFVRHRKGGRLSDVSYGLWFVVSLFFFITFQKRNIDKARDAISKAPPRSLTSTTVAFFLFVSCVRGGVFYRSR
jgi:preprotein translocase subunit SecG